MFDAKRISWAYRLIPYLLGCRVPTGFHSLPRDLNLTCSGQCRQVLGTLRDGTVLNFPGRLFIFRIVVQRSVIVDLQALTELKSTPAATNALFCYGFQIEIFFVLTNARFTEKIRNFP